MLVVRCLLCQLIFTLNPFRKVRHVLIDFCLSNLCVNLSSLNIGVPHHLAKALNWNTLCQAYGSGVSIY